MPTTEPAPLVAAATFGLPGGPRRVVIESQQAEAVLGLAEFDRLGGFLGRAHEAGQVDCDEATATAITELWHRQLVGSVLAESTLVHVAGVLAAAGVEWRITKGPALAHLDYRDPSLRTFGDVDIVVAERDWTRSLDALAEVGVRRLTPELRPGFDPRYGKGATLATPDGQEVDAHLRFAIGRFGMTARMSDVFQDAEWFTVAGRRVPALAGHDRLLHACYHAALGGFRHVRATRDIAQLLVVTGVDWERTVERAQRWDVEAVVAHAIRECWDMFALDPGQPAADWARRYRSSRRDAEALAVFTAERSFRDQALTSLPALPWWDRPRYLWYLAGPARAAGGARRTWWHRLTRARRRAD